MICNNTAVDDCKLRNTVIIVDANFIINIANALSNDIDVRRTSWPKLTAQISDCEKSFIMYLDKFGGCALRNVLSTSDIVFRNELDPMNNDATIRKEWRLMRDFCDTYRAKDAQVFLGKMHSCLSSRIELVQVRNEEIASIRQFLTPHPRFSTLGDKDLSIIACALKETAKGGSGVCLSTADETLREALEKVKESHTVTLSSQTCATEGILPLTVYGHMYFPHRCCKLSNAEHGTPFFFLVRKDMERFQQMSFEKRRSKISQIDEMLRVRDATVELKALKMNQNINRDKDNSVMGN